MKLSDVMQCICDELSNLYEIKFYARPIAGEGDINFQVAVKPFDNDNLTCTNVYLNYTDIKLEMDIINKEYVLYPVFSAIRECSQRNIDRIIELEASIKQQDCTLIYIINQSKYDSISDINDSNWERIGVRLVSGYIPAYNQYDISYDSIKGIIILFCSLVLMLSSKQEEYGELKEEGASYNVLATRYERNPVNRAICLESKGYKCSVCGISMEDIYGDIGKEFIEVHHIIPVSTYEDKRLIDPLMELFPVCPNCHAMLHRKTPPYTIEELRKIINTQKSISGKGEA